jgi:hypothetical protein
MGALRSLDISYSGIGTCIGDDLPKGWTYDNGYSTCYRHKDGNQTSPPSGAKSSGVIAIANAISDMGALTKLDISMNGIPSEQQAEIQRICAAGGIELVSS